MSRRSLYSLVVCLVLLVIASGCCCAPIIVYCDDDGAPQAPRRGDWSPIDPPEMDEGTFQVTQTGSDALSSGVVAWVYVCQDKFYDWIYYEHWILESTYVWPDMDKDLQTHIEKNPPLMNYSDWVIAHWVAGKTYLHVVSKMESIPRSTCQ